MPQDCDISVVVPVRFAESTVARTLGELLERDGLEVVAVVSREDPTVETLRFLTAVYPALVIVEMNGPRSVPELRAAGIRRARGRLVAITEDHCTFSESWPAALAPALDDPKIAASGGVVVNGREGSLVDWAIFFSRYLTSMPPMPRGTAASLPGNNACYRRDLLDLTADLYRDGFWEHEFHQELQKRGYRLWLEPDAIVQHNKPYSMGAYWALRYRHGRCFGGMAARAMGPARRLMRVVLSPTIPALLAARAVRAITVKRRQTREFALSLPFLLMFQMAWFCGELTGYLRGPAACCSKTD